MKKRYLVIFISVVCFINKSKSQCTFTTAVPYFETFAGVTSPNQLPTCWTASNLGNTCLTFTSAQFGNLIALTGSQYAGFAASLVGSNYFYSQGIQLNSGVTYSTSLWFKTEYYGYTNWSDLSILIGPNQNTLNLVQVASTNTTAVSAIYKSVSNTFTVATSGIYYVAIRATSSSSTGASYLIFDDFKIDSLCMAPLNLSASATTICAGQSVSLTVTGANTYTWNTGSHASSIIVTPNNNVTYSVVGTNTLTSCTSTSSTFFITVNPSPNVITYVSQPVLCSGQTSTLTAFGAINYTWSTAQQTNTISVTPSVTTSYSVSGSNNFGCTSSAVQSIQVNPLPTVTVLSAIPSNTICNGDLDTLNASGANSYTWTYSQSTLLGSQIIVTPSVTTNYTVTGIDMNGCASQTSFVLNVNGCTGLNHLVGTNYDIKIFPNPFQDEFLLSTGSNEIKAIEISDLSGRTILSLSTKEERIIVNTRSYANSIYYIKIKSEEKTTLLKMIKN